MREMLGWGGGQTDERWDGPRGRVAGGGGGENEEMEKPEA